MTIKHLILMCLFVTLPCTGLASYDDALNPMGCTFDDMQQFYMDELGIEDDVTIKLLRQRMSDPRTHGFTKPLKNGHYLIALAKGLEPSEIRITLAHELVHVKQLVNGEIKKEEFRKDYLIRDFEDEAFRLSIPLATRFYTGHNCRKETFEGSQTTGLRTSR